MFENLTTLEEKMSWKYINFLIVLFITSSFLTSPELFGQYEFEKNDTLNVIAFSGLNVREYPSRNSKILYKLNYGDKITVENTRRIKKDTIEMRIGNWILVNNGKISGYTFDGFLTKMNVPSFNQIEDYDLVSYLYEELTIGKSCTIEYELPEISKKRGGPVSITRLSSNVVFMEITQYECRTSKFIFNEIRQSELISLLDLFYSNSKISNSNLNLAINKNLGIDETFNSKWSIYYEGYGIGFDYYNGYNAKSVSFFECN